MINTGDEDNLIQVPKNVGELIDQGYNGNHYADFLRLFTIMEGTGSSE